MKTLLLAVSLVAAGVSTANAQVYQPAIVNGSILGGIAGAIIGGHNHDRWGEGALIGATAGALLGASVEQPRAVVYQQQPVPVVQYVPTAQAVPNAPVVAAPGYGTPQVVYVQQPPAQVVYVPYYAIAPVLYQSYYPAYPVYYPSIRIGLGYSWGGPRHVSFRPGFRHW